VLIGERVRQRLEALQQEYPVIGDVRGLGAMMGMELVKDPLSKEPAADLAKTFRARLFENGVVNIGAGTYHNVVRVLPPLTIEDDTLEQGLAIVAKTAAEVFGTKRN